VSGPRDRATEVAWSAVAIGNAPHSRRHQTALLVAARGLTAKGLREERRMVPALDPLPDRTSVMAAGRIVSRG
jgi:hypothetical protein